MLPFLYSSIIDAGIHQAPSIKVAEAAKVTENIQRDVNIGLINELATIFEKLSFFSKDPLIVKKSESKFILDESFELK